MSVPRIFLLSTQHLPADLVSMAAESGIKLDAIAFIRTEPVGPAVRVEGPATVVFTSQHAVEALPELAGDWTVFCLEGATRRLVEKRFPAARLGGVASNAGELAESILAAGVSGTVEFFCGDQRREELPAKLRSAGIGVRETVVYRTVPTPVKLDRVYAGVAFFSPSATESFFTVNPDNQATAYFAIGRTTAGAVLAQTGKEAVVASRPDKEILIREMIAHFKV